MSPSSSSCAAPLNIAVGVRGREADLRTVEVEPIPRPPTQLVSASVARLAPVCHKARQNLVTMLGILQHLRRRPVWLDFGYF